MLEKFIFLARAKMERTGPQRRASAAAAIRKKLRLVRLATILVGFLGITFAILAAEAVFTARTANALAAAAGSTPSAPNPLGQTDLSDVYKALSTLFTLGLLACAAAKAALNFRLRGTLGTLFPQQTLWDTPLARELLLELAVYAVHCPIGLYGTFTVTNPVNIPITYDTDSLLSVLMFLRLAAVVSLLIEEVSGFGSAEAERVRQQLKDVSFDSSFASRHLLDNMPIGATCTVYIFTIGVLTYAMRVAERPICFTPAARDAGWCVPFKDLNSPYNAAWCIIITSLTVGYGDLYPFTQLGRAVAVTAAMVGICIIAMLVNAVTAATRFNADESRARVLLSQQGLKKLRKELAARVVGAAVLFALSRARRVSQSPLARTAAPAGAAPRSPGWTLTGAPSRRSVVLLARALGAWAPLSGQWRDNMRCKDTAEEVKGEVEQLRASVQELHEKLDALLGAVGMPLPARALQKQQGLAQRKSSGGGGSGAAPRYGGGLDPGWERKTNTQGEVWFEHPASGQTRLEPPTASARAWSAAVQRLRTRGQSEL